MQRRRFLAATGAVGAMSLLGISTQPASGQELASLIAQKVRTLKGESPLTLRIMLPAGSTLNVAPVADRFTAQTGTNIEFIETPVDEINSQVLIESLAGTGNIDLALPATFGIPDLVSAGAILDLSEFAKRHEPPDFQDDAMYTLGDYFKGKFYGYQTDGDTYLIFLNDRLLADPDHQKRYADRYGIQLQLPQTWQELDRQMSFFHRPQEGVFGGALFRTPLYIAWEYWVRFHAKGYWPFDHDMRPQIATEPGVEALQELIAASKHQYPFANSNGLFDNWKAYAKGNIYCNIGWGGTQKVQNGPNSATKGKLKFCPIPGGIADGQPFSVPYFNWGWNYTVLAGAPSPEIAYLFSLFACTSEMSTIAVREADGFFDPFRAAHYEDAEIQETYSEAFLAAHRTSMLNSIPDLYLSGQSEYFEALSDNLLRADTGDLTPEQAMDLTAQQWEQTTQRLGRDEQAEQWAFLRKRYPERLQRILR